MGEQWMFAVFPGGLLGVLAMIARFQQGSWLAPGAFFSLFWTVAVAYPLLLSDYKITQGVLLWILAMVFAFYIGSSIGDGSLLKSARYNARSYNYYTQIPFISCIIIVCAVLGILSSVINVLTFGYSFASLLTWKGYIKVAKSFTEMRYGGQFTPPFVSQLLLIPVYMGPLFAGLLYGFHVSARSKVLIILSFVPAIVIALLQTTRSTIAYAGILFFAAYLSVLVLREGRRVQLFTLKRAILGIIAMGFISLNFTVLQLIREGDVPLCRIVSEIYWLARNYYTQYLPLYSIWIEDYWDNSKQPSFGAATFAGISDVLGIRKKGLFISYHDVIPGIVRSNVLPLFVALTQDFTIPGALVALFLWGMVTGLSYQKVAKGRKLYLPILTAFYAVTLWSPIATLLGYNSIIGSLILFSGYIFVALKEHRFYRIKGGVTSG